jgi:hypothetical protein
MKRERPIARLDLEGPWLRMGKNQYHTQPRGDVLCRNMKRKSAVVGGLQKALHPLVRKVPDHPLGHMRGGVVKGKPPVRVFCPEGARERAPETFHLVEP